MRMEDPPPSSTLVHASTHWVDQEGIRNAEYGGIPPAKSNTDDDNMFGGNDRLTKDPSLRRSFPAAPAWGGDGASLGHVASARATPGGSGAAPATPDGSAARAPRKEGGGRTLGENSGMMSGLAVEAGDGGEGGGVGRAQSSTGGGDARLRGLTSKLRHPLADVRGRAISNLSGKISLGLLSPSDLLREEPSFFSDVVALLSEGIGFEPSGNRSPERGSLEGSSASAILVLNLCVLLVKDPGCRARLAGGGAAIPLSRMMTMAESSRTKGGGELRLLAAEVLELVETSPGTRVAPESVAVSGEGPGTASLPPVTVPARQQGLAWREVDLPNGQQSPEHQHQHQQETEEACALFGDGSKPRWPRWTKDFVDGPLLSAGKNASSETVVACLCAGWRFPHVRLVRSEESALFDFEVRFRTASTPAGETGLLRCLRHLRDEIVEDYPPEVLLQRPGSFGRLLSLLRTPSASERVIEEALSTASRLLERLVRSARLHQDPSFLPPSPSASVDIDDQRAPAAGESDGYAFGGAPAGYVPGGGGAAGGSTVFGTRYGRHGGGEPTDTDSGWPGFRGDEEENHRRRHRQRVLWEQQQQRQQQQQAGVPQDQRMRTTMTPGDAAVATLLSFRYPRSSPTVRFTAGGAASTARDGRLGGKRGAAGSTGGGEVPEELGKAGPGGSGGVSVCGALFALFLSACPLLGYPAANKARVTLASGGGRVNRSDEKGGGPASEPSGGPSRVAVLAGEMLQAVIPYLLEPQGNDGDWGESTDSASAGGVGGAAAGMITCPVDALRVQEVLCSTGQVLGYTGGGVAPDGGAPEPLVSIAVQLLLLLSPDDLVPGNDEQFAGGGCTVAETSVKLPPRLVLQLRDMVLDAGEAERRPSLRSRLWPLLARASPKEAEMLQAAQVLTRQAALVLNIGREGAGGGSGPGMIEGCGGGAAANRGTSCDWSWVRGTLGQIKAALPLLRSVDDPRLVSIAVALWFSAANAAFSSSSGSTSPVEPREAEGIGGAVVVKLVHGEFGERASAQAMHMLDELTAADDTVAAGSGCIQVPPSFAEAMARHGLADPRKRPLTATRLAAALAVVLGGGNGVAGDRVGAVASAVTRSAPSSPLFSAVLLRGTATSGSPGNAGGGGGAAASAPAAAARRVIARSCTALHGVLRSDGKAKNVSLTAAATAAAATARALSPTLEAFIEVCRAAERTAASPTTPSTAAAPAWPDEGAAANGCFCGHARLPAGQSEERASSWREARRAVSSLLDFVDGLLEDETKQGLHPAAQGQFQAGDGVLSSPPLRRHRSPTTNPSLVKSAAARRMWVEVRGLCGGEANARAAASRRLAGLLKETTIPEDERGVKQGGAVPFPFLYLDDPLHLPPSATPIASTVANNGASGKPAASERAPSEGQTLSFSAEHVRNLADVAGAPSLEGGLRRAAAEQLRGVLVSPGVAAVVLSDTGEEDLCERVLSAALSGLLPRPQPPSSPIPSGSDGDRSEDPWPSPRPPCPLPGIPSAAAASPGTVVTGGRSGRSGVGEHLWDEAFLGLLLAAVGEFAPIRRYLLAACSGRESGGCSRTAEPELALAAGSPALGHLSRSRKGATAAAIVPPNALPSVLRRLYHPRPSVRRLAGSVAVRLAFDSPSFFSPLECTLESPPSSRVGRDSDNERGRCGRCRVGGVASLGEGFSVPMMVLEAFPRLAELTRERTSSGGGGSENTGGDSSPSRRNENRNGASSSGRRRHEAFHTLVASEWTLVLIPDTAADGPAHRPGVAAAATAAADPSSKKSGERHHRSAVASQVAEALREAGRRTEFEAAMLKARAWMLAGFGCSEALFGPDGGWETAFERFLRAPPNGTKDRAAMRDVTSLLVAGTDHMCPRSFQVLADAAEECFVPILSETNRRPTTVLGDYLGDWRAPSSSKGSARDLESKRGLRESVLELLVAVVSSSRPGSDEAAVSLAASSLPAVIWGEFLGGRAVGVMGWSWWERGDAEDGGTPLTARRLAAEFLTGLARRPRTGSAAVASWASLHVLPPESDHDELGGESQNLLAAAGWGGESSPAQHLSEPEPAPLLGMIVRSLVRHASTHRSPDGFRGRASLAASLVALETVLAAAALSPSSTPSPLSEGNGSAELTKSPPTSPVPVAFFAGRGVPHTPAFGQGCRGEGVSGGGGAGDKTGLEWALRLACHRDATVRAVSFGVLAELAVVDRGLLVPTSSSAPRDSPAIAGGPEQGDESPTRSGGYSARAGQSAVVGSREEDEEEEAVEACVRAALDGRYESPVVATEALRFLCRHTNVRATFTRRLPAYSVPLAASLAKSAAPVLGGESGQNKAGSLSVAAASLRFIVVVVAAAVDISDAAARSKVPGTADRGHSPGEQREPQEEPRRDDQHELHQQCGQKLGRLLEVLWALGLLEACVHVVGEALPVEGSSGGLSRRDGWSSLLASSPAEAAMVYRSAQAAALALLRVVVSRPTVSATRPTPAASTPPPLEQTAASAAERVCTPGASASAAGSRATDHDDGGGSAAVAASTSGGSNRPSATTPAGSGGVDVWVVVRQALLQRTPLLAGLVRCLVAAAAAAAVLRGGGGTADRDSPCDGAVRVVQEACATLRCLLCRTDGAVVSGDNSGCSGVSQAVLEALGVVLAETPSEDGVKWDGGVSRRCGNGCTEAAKTEAKLLLAAMLATRAWRCSLDLACEKASSLAAVLLEEEAVALTRTTAPGATRNAVSAEAELRRRCLVPLLESSDALRALAVTSGLIGDLSVALEALLGEIATVGHGRETLQNASRHLETLKAKHKKPTGGKKKTTATPSSPTSPSSDARGGGEGRAHTGKPSNKYAGRKPPIPTANAKLVAATSPKPSAATARRTSTPSTAMGQGRRRSSSLSPPPSMPSSPPLKAARAPVQSVDRGLGPEREFYMVAALMASAIGGPEGRAEALRLRLPQLLWKAWPMALASQLAHSSRSSSHRRHDHHDHRRGSTSVGSCGMATAGTASGRRDMLETPVLLQALLGLASCVARSCPEGKKAFIFAGPEGSSSPEASGAEGGGEWPRSSRSLLHRVAALALSCSPSTGGEGRADAGPYGRAATEAACDVVRSCALSHECRTVLSQSGFFVDAFAQIIRLCAKAAKTKPGTASFTTLARRIGDLAGVLVNSSLRAEGQKALMQVEGACDMLGDLVAVCLRATSPTAATAATTTYSVLVTRTLLLLRNLALAPSTGQIAAHRTSVVDLILRSTGREGEGELTRAAVSCLRAVLRGSSNDGGGKTAVGVGDRGSELAAAVDRCLGVPEIAALSHSNGLMRRVGTVGGHAERQLRRELLAAKELLL